MDNTSIQQLALQRKRYAHLSDEEWRFMLQQVEGRQRTRDKLPTFATIEDWWYPVRLSCEQCSSELTARHKTFLLKKYIQQPFVLIDLTGGYGVDTFFMSEGAVLAHYIERNEELYRIVAHNFATFRPQVLFHNTTAENFLKQYPSHHTTQLLTDELSTPQHTVIYIDPARRNHNGNKVFRLEDCEPNIIHLLPTLHAKAQTIIIKLSPMLDITAALNSLGGIWDVHIIAVKNEVKEVLLISTPTLHDDTTARLSHAISIHATNLLPNGSQRNEQQDFIFTQEEEKQAHCILYTADYSHLTNKGFYIYEPNAAIIKAGAFKLIAQRYNLCKMAQHTHLYLAAHLIENFPGRVWQIIETNIKDTKNIHANILTRNYPLTPEQLRKKLKIKDNDTFTIIGARLADKPSIFFCQKI